jgi:hypothetical protein
MLYCTQKISVKDESFAGMNANGDMCPGSCLCAHLLLTEHLALMPHAAPQLLIFIFSLLHAFIVRFLTKKVAVLHII